MTVSIVGVAGFAGCGSDDETRPPVRRSPSRLADVGILVVYDDGIARFESDSATVRWLTDEFRESTFVC